MTVEISEAAKSDLRRALRFYDGKPGRYGSVLKRDFRTAVRRVGQTPKLYAPVEDELPGFEVREYLIERFNQRVIYVLSESSPVVIAMIHTSKQLGSWHDRLKKT